MKLIISDKLDFLMRVTDTKNNLLGKAISVDPSYVSRIRNGSRGVPKHREFINPAADFFAHAIRTEAQKKAAAAALCPGKSWPSDFTAATRLIAAWMREGVSNDSSFIKKAHTGKPFLPVESEIEVSSLNSDTSFYFGNAGKRACAIRFLTELASLNEPVKLLLHSEEDMLWLYENPKFVKNWALLLNTILQKGGHITIVHTVRRTLGEMLEAVAKWAPLYAAGAIESYYCPRLRDNIFRRTMFIGCGKAAILAHTTGEAGKNRLNILLHDAQALKALEKEFYDYLDMCRPLMKVFNASNFEQISIIAGRFQLAKTALMQFHGMPSWLTLSDEIVRNFAKRSGSPEFYNYMSHYRDLLFLQDTGPVKPVIDIISLPDIDTVKSGAVPVPLADFFGAPGLCYTADEFRMHLTASLQLLKTSPNYIIVLLSPDSIPKFSEAISPKSFSVIASESAGVILHNLYKPTTLFYTREQDMTVSFCEYLERFIKKSGTRESTIIKLQQYLDKLEEATKG